MFARVNAVFKINDKSLTVPEEAIVPQAGRQFVIKVVTQTEQEAKALAEKAKVAAAAAAASAPVAAGGPGAGAAPAAQAPVFVDGKRLVSLRTEVKVGLRRQGRVELTDGVAEGDTVVVAGQQRLQRDNTPVRIVELGRPGGAGGGGAGAGAGVGAAATGASPVAPSAAGASAAPLPMPAASAAR